MKREPLNLPRGSVRAILTILLVVVSAVALFVPVADEDVKGMFLLLTGIGVRDYFEHRRKQEEEDGPVMPDPLVNED